MNTKILDRVNGPADLNKLSADELTELANEIRPLLINKLSQTGGHVGPNLGVVELTIALHTVFNSPVDHIIWDVSHQAYTHKILTGRKAAWLSPDHFHDVGPYTDPQESPHDYFNIGHTSTSIGLADGMAVARDHRGDHENVIAVIGDGALSGGLAYEALSNAATLHSNLIIVVNDNEMSIAEDHGGLYKGLAQLRATNGKSPNNLFKSLGLDYMYVEGGNDIPTLLAAFTQVHDIDHPIVVHVHTIKGLGYAPALANEEAFHWHSPFDVQTGAALAPSAGRTYADVVLDELDAQIAAGVPIEAITAAIPGGFHLKKFAAKHPDRYHDVGIAEQQSITFAAGLAKAGARPVAFENTTFLQRAYDQLSHDLGVNKLPAVIVYSGGHVTGGDPTHQSTFDLAMLTNIPGFTVLVPANAAELTAALRWALAQNDWPVAIRLPRGGVDDSSEITDYDPNKMRELQAGHRVALLAIGSMLPLAQQVADKLQADSGITATVVDPRRVDALTDTKELHHLAANHELVVTLEENSLAGGFGEKVSAYFGPTNVRTLNLGAKRRFDHKQTRDELMNEYKLTVATATSAIEDILD
ncbi:1-deoxy-D-xylulose-5-phosphate synthase [Lacticaseibacillus hulanensis]|uniref:1-deoxy-D-xylulose-5-phosphate synthase n=1 Tax=Lacticaseibacillus hulanensis TaxID=2493111 RepID=UPI000FDC88CA|nr:1-deoxy-D-xylulose-5-phosphate synthase [Lacticaseibacillus hulanensis]